MIGANNLKTKTGIYVFEIQADGHANNSQLRIGDIIVEFEGQPVETVDRMHKYLQEEVIGKKTTLGVLRQGRKELITVVPGELR